MKPLRLLSFGIALSFTTALVPAQTQTTTTPQPAQQQPSHPQANGAAKGALPMNVLLVSGPQAAGAVSYQPVSAWYKNKHWWKRNAPVVGGAGGGALVGGLVGGGAGALVGGAVGGGGGYLYKRHKEHHHHHYHGHK